MTRRGAQHRGPRPRDPALADMLPALKESMLFFARRMIANGIAGVRGGDPLSVTEVAERLRASSRALEALARRQFGHDTESEDDEGTDEFSRLFCANDLDRIARDVRGLARALGEIERRGKGNPGKARGRKIAIWLVAYAEGWNLYRTRNDGTSPDDAPSAADLAAEALKEAVDTWPGTGCVTETALLKEVPTSFPTVRKHLPVGQHSIHPIAAGLGRKHRAMWERNRHLRLFQ